MGRVILSILFVMVSYAAHASELPSIFQPEPQPTVQPSPSASPQPVEPQDKIPIYCFQSALQLGLTFHQSILLCTNAKTLEPIRCIRLRFNQKPQNWRQPNGKQATDNGQYQAASGSWRSERAPASRYRWRRSRRSDRSHLRIYFDT